MRSTAATVRGVRMGPFTFLYRADGSVCLRVGAKMTEMEFTAEEWGWVAGRSDEGLGVQTGEATVIRCREHPDQIIAMALDEGFCRCPSAGDCCLGTQPRGVAVSDPLLQFFRYEHLPPNLQEVSMPFARIANWVVESLPRNPERTVALRKLLEAKDCAVRAVAFKD